jgi:spectrin alpha
LNGPFIEVIFIQAVQDAGQTLIDETQFRGPEINDRLRQLNDVWEELKELAASRGRKLDESITYQQFLAKIEEEEAW